MENKCRLCNSQCSQKYSRSPLVTNKDFTNKNQYTIHIVEFAGHKTSKGRDYGGVKAWFPDWACLVRFGIKKAGKGSFGKIWAELG